VDPARTAGAQPHAILECDLHPRRAGIDHERRDAGQPFAFFGAGQHDESIGPIGVEHAGLDAVEQIAVTLTPGDRGHVAQMRRGIVLAAGQRPHALGVAEKLRDLSVGTQRDDGLRREAQIIQTHRLGGIAAREDFFGQDLGREAEADPAGGFGQAQEVGAHFPIGVAHGRIDGLAAIGGTGIGHELVLGEAPQGIEQGLLVLTAREGNHEATPLHGLNENPGQRPR
jgi:hypothetical protein